MLSGEHMPGLHHGSQLSLCPGGTYTLPADRACDRFAICTRYAKNFAFSPPTCLGSHRPIALHHIAVLLQVLLCFPLRLFQFVPAGEVLRAHRSRKSSENPVTNYGFWCDAVGVRSHVHVINSQVEGWRQARVLVQDV